MHVTAVTPKYPPTSRVGAWIATHGMMRALVDAGHTVEVVPSLDRPGQRYKLGGVQVLPYDELDAALGRADIVVSHLGDGGAAHDKAKAMRKPSVIMVHSAKVDQRALAGAALVVCNSKATQVGIGKYHGRKVVVHPYSDPEVFATTPGDRITLVNLSSQKGGDVFWRLARTMPGFKFLGVRGGYGNQVIHDLPNVDVVGPTNNMRDEVYSRTKILLMPSMSESWGMVAVEAMCSGIPVLARPTPGLRECLGSAGMWVDSTSTSAWSSAIKALLVPNTWQKMSEASLARSAALSNLDDRRIFVKALEALA